MNGKRALADQETHEPESDVLRSVARELAGAADIPRDYLSSLFGRAAPEDLVAYSASELALLGKASYAHLQERLPGKPKIRIENLPPAAGARRLDAVTVIEIVNDNMPFLLDSVMGELNEQGVSVCLVAHPIFSVERDREGKLVVWHGEAGAAKEGLRESVIQIHVERIDPEHAERIADALASVLAEVRLAVSDWQEMRGRVDAVIEALKSNPPPLPQGEVHEAVAFLEWLAADNFTFLGCRDYAYTDAPDREMLEPIAATGRGILRNPDLHVLRRAGKLVTTTPALRAFMREPVPLVVTKANVRSRVHRRVHLDYIGVKRFDAQGKITGEFRIVGLFTSTAYTRRASGIPYLRRKVEQVLARARFDPASHSGKALVNVLENYPRDELFQIDVDLLYRFALEILQLEERPRVRVLVRPDKFDRYVSVLVYIPRERYDSAMRVKIGNFLAETLQGRVSAFYPFFLDGPLTRVHFIIGRDDGPTPEPDQAMLEFAVERLVRNWSDRLARELETAHELSKARALERRYRDAFSAGYQEAYTPRAAVGDIRVLETLSPENEMAVDFHRSDPADKTQVNLKLFSHGRPLPLSERVPVLENMGFTVIDEQTYTVEPRDGRGACWLHDMLLRRSGGGEIDVESLGGRLESCLMAVARGRAENDGFNALVLGAGLPWRDVALIRTLSRYLRQARIAYSQDYLWSTLNRYPAVAAKIVTLFHMRFDPRVEVSGEERSEREAAIVQEIEQALGAVESLDDDQILRRFVNLVKAALRTNFYQAGADGQAKPIISIKFESRKIEELPLPKPLYEIFVYSPRVEGIHLRFGKVARGGIRWSDRPQDFRTEVLGLVKAQQVKNAVIVPFGAKGGFVPKRLPAGGGREAVLAEGTAAYELFISSLLEITDNLGPQGIVPPPDIVRHDGDDPYLVVAADKGTATFSDTANGIAERHGFWLGDAFASGGSAGYDHKKMGITARGAWEAVKRHFREMDFDIHKTPFMVAGVGDMSGDVFGNGMLLEKTIKLVAAFDHRDIFIDPAPDPARSWAERKRLFELPRSSWADYDKSLISEGGGVFPRKAKSIPLSPEMRALLDLDMAEATPAQVMQAILKARVDLLWFGGIGTYVRASIESDDRVGDRANDPIRVTGADLRCRVIGEGANLGMTQLGRVEAARRRIRLNTDAIDNSAGVNSSDVEVNLKIALSVPMREQRLQLEERNQLLAGMTDDVAALVLRNNYLQPLALSLAERRGTEDLGFQVGLMHALEADGALDRSVEFLPSDIEIGERRLRGQALTRPELAVLLAYAKLSLFGALLESEVPDDPYLARELVRYFPKAVAERFPDAVQEHRLRREIIATMLSNSMINRGGPSLIARVGDETGADAPAIAKAFAAVRDAYGMTDLNAGIDRLDGRVGGDLQLSLYAAVQDLLLDRINWFLRNVDLSQGLADIVARYRAGIDAVAAAVEKALPDEQHAARGARMSALVGASVPEPLARTLASLPELAAAPDIVRVAEETRQPIERATGVYFAVGAYFRLDRIVDAANAIELADHFDRLALDRGLVEIAASQRRLAAAALKTGESGEAAVQSWIAERGREIERVRKSIHDIAGGGLTLSRLAVAVGLLADLAKA
ncbi:MAG: NAD-glutamate dehydrogenase [Bradyrhizobiaceae bacterium]|nr:NAD-glutamate dehydrogenase [Bradyrhizobiaceae bacterium]